MNIFLNKFTYLNTFTIKMTHGCTDNGGPTGYQLSKNMKLVAPAQNVLVNTTMCISSTLYDITWLCTSPQTTTPILLASTSNTC